MDNKRFAMNPEGRVQAECLMERLAEAREIVQWLDTEGFYIDSSLERGLKRAHEEAAWLYKAEVNRSKLEFLLGKKFYLVFPSATGKVWEDSGSPCTLERLAMSYVAIEKRVSSTVQRIWIIRPHEVDNIEFSYNSNSALERAEVVMKEYFDHDFVMEHWTILRK